MKSKFNTIFGIAFFACVNVAFSQKISIPQKQDVVRSKNDLKYSSPQWRKDNYIVNRDSAFANPYYAIQKLRGGNRRFVEGRSIYPRQDAALIKKIGWWPIAICTYCWLFWFKGFGRNTFWPGFRRFICNQNRGAGNDWCLLRYNRICRSDA